MITFNTNAEQLNHLLRVTWMLFSVFLQLLTYFFYGEGTAFAFRRTELSKLFSLFFYSVERRCDFRFLDLTERSVINTGLWFCYISQPPAPPKENL